MRRTLITAALALVAGSAGFALAQATQPPPRLPVSPKLGKVRAYAEVGVLGAPIDPGRRLRAARDATLYLGRQASNRTALPKVYRSVVEAYAVSGCCGKPGFDRLDRRESEPFTLAPGGFLNDAVPLRLADLPDGTDAIRVGIEEAYELDGELDWHSVRGTLYHLAPAP